MGGLYFFGVWLVRGLRGLTGPMRSPPFVSPSAARHLLCLVRVFGAPASFIYFTLHQLQAMQAPRRLGLQEGSAKMDDSDASTDTRHHLSQQQQVKG